MKTKIIAGLLALAGTGIIFLALHDSPPGDASVPAVRPEERVPGPTETRPAPMSKSTALTTTVGSLVRPLPPQEVLWKQPVTEPPFAAFADWTRRYIEAPTAAAKMALNAEGAALAKVRLTAMADLIQCNPQRALELAVPHAVREIMPDAVKHLLEEKVNTRGDYQVLAVLQEQSGHLPPVFRSASISGQTYEVFSYGQQLQYVTRRNAPLNGIAVPANAATKPPGNLLLYPDKILALGPPARFLDQSEIESLRLARQREPVCSTSGQSVSSRGEENAVEVGGVIHTFCGKVHAEDWANANVAAAGLQSPGGDGLATAESPYTEGRKRMLLLRPIWSDYAGGMTTNDALSHWVNFSNYMYEMSYGKLVLAGLGHGSDITPPMVLPGLVAEYDNTGLGKLYNTCKDVARTNYGYDLSQYDFTYVCTGSKPAAGYCGLAFVGGVGFHLACWDAATSCHEFGHNLGLNHAHFWDTGAKNVVGSGQNIEYGDTNDPMGGGGSPNSYNSRYKNYLGWIRDTDVADLNATGSGLFRVYAFDLDNSVGLRGLKLRRTSSQNYWLNFRQRKTTKKALMNGAQLMWTGNGNEGSYALDVRLKGNADDNAIAIGRTFSDTNLGFHVTPVGKGHTYPESMDVRVNIGSVSANQPPTAVVDASTLNPAVGDPVTFNVAATDPNGDALAYYWEFGDSDYSVDNSATATHIFTTVGEYAVQCVVSDMKGGTARQSVLVRVGSPATIHISGHVLDRNNRPIPGVHVSTSAGKSVYSDSDGAYTIVGLAAGSYNVDAQEPFAGSMVLLHPSFCNPVTIGPGNYANADFIGVPNSSIINTPLVARASSWNYLDNGTDQGTAWRAGSFNDSGWNNSVAPLGYPSGAPITTVIGYGPDPNNKYITYYFRKQFNVANPAAFASLRLETLRDDGAVIYLNGTEVLRDNMPSGAISYLTAASSTVEAQDYIETSVCPIVLLAGVNTLAVEVHQSDRTSSDVVFDAALIGLSLSSIGLNLAYISSPADHAVFTSVASVPITASAFSSTGSVSLVEFYADGMKVGDASIAPYTWTWNGPAVGSHTLRVVATFGSLLLTSPPVTVKVAAPVAPPIALSLIQTGAVWKYLAGPTSAPPLWAGLTFNDGSWPSGSAQLGYGDGDEATVIPYGGNINNKWVTYYFRRAFTVDDPAVVTNLVVRLLRDDGGIVYLNGAEVFRSNITNGPVNYLTFAFNAADDGTIYFSNPVDPALLQPGTNVVAVEIHQTSATSSDVSFDLALDALASNNRSRGLWMTSPADGSTMALPGTATLSAQVVVGPGFGVSKIEFFADTLKVGEALVAPFNFSWSNPPGGAHAVLAVATDTVGNSITSAPVNFTVTAPPIGTALVSFGDIWKYMDDGSNQGTNWVGRTFNDSQWMAGPAKLGYGSDGEITTVSYGTNANNRFLTTYFRKSFVVTNPGSFSALLLRLIRDDGAVVYLNGTEVYRNNIQAGPVSWNSLATATVDPLTETTPVETMLDPAGLIAGTNVFAVEIHQASVTSSDLGFDLALIGLNSTNTTEGVYLTNPVNGTHFNAPVDVGLSAYVAALAPVMLVEYFDGTTKVAQATANPYNATWSGAPVGVHTLTAYVTYGAGLQMTSGPVAITVGNPPPPILPVFATLIAPSSGWKYWDSANAVSNGWQGAMFDDTAWPSANARFGWGLDGELTPLTEGRVTHYFRRWFTLAGGGRLSDLLFELVRDDGAVVYLNGVEVYRSNMPAGMVTATTLAAGAVDTPDETTWFETVRSTAGSGLLSGSNLVAVELHQSSAISLDASFDFALYGQGTTEGRVYLSSPAAGASLLNGLPIPLEVLAWAGSGLSVTNVEFFADAMKIGESASAPYRMTWIGAALGPHVLTARLTDNNGAALDSGPVTINVTRELVTTTLIASNSVWKYLDNGSNQGTNWAQLAYNDGGWSSGAARLGFGGDGEVTVLRGQPVVTYFFRKTFVVPPGVIYTNLLFSLVRDDGAVVWLNGRETYRSNMGTGIISFNTPAASTVNAPDEQTFFQTTIVVANLPAGTNLVAVEVHQINSTSSDIGFNLEFVGSGYLEDTTPPSLAVQFTEGMIELSWATLMTGWRVYGAPTLDTPINTWTPVTGTPVTVTGRNVLSVTPSAAQQFFRLGRP